MKQHTIFPILFINLNILNILDKYITYISLQNPLITEANPIVNYAIKTYGASEALILYMILGFIWISAIYIFITRFKTVLEKQNISPTGILITLNIIFYFIVSNNIFQTVQGEII